MGGPKSTGARSSPPASPPPSGAFARITTAALRLRPCGAIATPPSPTVPVPTLLLKYGRRICATPPDDDAATAIHPAGTHTAPTLACRDARGRAADADAAAAAAAGDIEAKANDITTTDCGAYRQPSSALLMRVLARGRTADNLKRYPRPPR
jgi:hypothetical protein